MTDWLNRISPGVHIAESSPAAADWVEPLRVIYDHELVLFSAGRFVVEVEGLPYDCPAGTFVVIPPGRPERAANIGAAPGCRHWVHFDWVWQPYPPGTPVMSYAPLPVETTRLRPAPAGVPAGVLHGPMRDPERALDLHRRLERRWVSAAVRDRLACRGILLELLCELLAGEAPHGEADVRLHALLLRVRERLREIAAAPVAATPPIRRELARLGYSYGHLLNLFKAHAGITPHEYVTALRMERAKRLLRTTAMTVAEVGYALGIDNPPYFTRLFRRSTGRTPTAFRNEARH